MIEYHDIAAVLFDLDGTLIEHTRDLRDLCREIFDAFAEDLAPVTPDEFWETFWPKNHDTWYMMVDGILAGDVARLYSFINTLRAFQADERLARPMLQDWEDRIIAATCLFDDALPVIGRLRSAGLQLGVITNGYTTMQIRKIGHHGLETRLDFVLVSEAAGVHKPDKAIFDLALARAEVAAHQALFIGEVSLGKLHEFIEQRVGGFEDRSVAGSAIGTLTVPERQSFGHRLARHERRGRFAHVACQPVEHIGQCIVLLVDLLYAER